jgi:hypothetical protein
MMPKYRLEYDWSVGDEDPCSDQDFIAKTDYAAAKKAQTFGREGDVFRLYRLVKTMAIKKRQAK